MRFFNPDTSKIVGTCFQSNIGIWDTPSGQLVQNITEPTTTINQAHFNNNSGNIIIAAGQDGFTRMYDARTGKLTKLLTGFGYTLAAQQIDDNRIVSTFWPNPNNTPMNHQTL